MSSGSSSTTEHSSSDTSLSEFIQHYYQHLADDDAGTYSPDALTERALEHRSLAATRLTGEALVGVFDQDDASIVMIVTDDMPFLVDSVTAELVRQQAAIRLVVHPTFVVVRNRSSSELMRLRRVPSSAGSSSGDTAALPNLAELVAENDISAHVESWITVEVGRIGDETRRAAIIEGLQRVLADVRAAVEDWTAMRSKLREVSTTLQTVPESAGVPDLEQARELLDWLDQGNFTFLGYKEYDLETENGEDVLGVRDDSGLGLLRHPTEGRQIQHLTQAGRAKAREKQPLVITKANSRSTVHRAAYLDYIGIKQFDQQGNVCGERRFIGLFAHQRIHRNPCAVCRSFGTR